MTGIVLAVAAGTLLLAASGWSAAPPISAEQAAADRGQKIFASTCSFCHGSQARGGEGGPDLLESTLVIDDVDGNKIGPVILNGRPDGGMPKFSMTAEQISDIASFLHRSIHAAGTRRDYKVLNILTGDATAGKAYFDGAGQCNRCHSVTGDLKGIGAKYDPVALQDIIVMPRKSGGRYNPSTIPATERRTVTVTLPSGEAFQGVLEHIDDFNVALLDASGQYRSFQRNGDVPAVVVHDPLQAHYDMLTKYSDSDIHNLTAYLVTLK